jgi:hypothetical protein
MIEKTNEIKNNYIIIMYPKDRLEEVVNQLKEFGFLESNKPRINLGNKIIANLNYGGKENFSDAINKIKEFGINYEIPSLYKICDDSLNQDYKNDRF